jgi:hypothetical protein
VVGLFGFLVAIGLILYGRPRLLKLLLDRKHVSSNINISWIQKHEN